MINYELSRIWLWLGITRGFNQMKRFELSIEITDEAYIDFLIIALVRQGYDVYYNPDSGGKYGHVCFTVGEGDDLTEVTQ